MVRMMPTIIGGMNVDRILADLHYFLKAYPSYTWKNRQTDMPLRTVKTILHTFVKIKGSKIMSHLTLIDHNDQSSSEVESYLRKLLRTAGAGELAAANSRNEQLSANATLSPKSDVSDGDKKSPRQISRTVHDTLADIFKKIGSKENTREGLNDLYDFKRQHPDADLNPFLKKSTQFFQDYIERGLKNVELERQEKQKTMAARDSSGSSAPSGSNVTTAVATDASAADYLERLKVLRARCGLDNDGNARTDSTLSDMAVNITKSCTSTLQVVDGSVSAEAKDSQVSEAAEPSTANAVAANQVSDIDDLKKRLARIKSSVKD